MNAEEDRYVKAYLDCMGSTVRGIKGCSEEAMEAAFPEPAPKPVTVYKPSGLVADVDEPILRLLWIPTMLLAVLLVIALTSP